MAACPLHPAMAFWCHVQCAKVVRRPPPLLEVRTPIVYSYRYLGKNCHDFRGVRVLCWKPYPILEQLNQRSSHLNLLSLGIQFGVQIRSKRVLRRISMNLVFHWRYPDILESCHLLFDFSNLFDRFLIAGAIHYHCIVHKNQLATLWMPPSF